MFSYVWESLFNVDSSEYCETPYISMIIINSNV